MPCTDSDASPPEKRSNGRIVPTKMKTAAPATIAAAVRMRSHQIGCASRCALSLRSRDSDTSSPATLRSPDSGKRAAIRSSNRSAVSMICTGSSVR